MDWLDETNAHFHVNIFDDTIEDIRTELDYNELSKHTIYITGQSGAGKTTALNFLPDERTKEKYEAVKFYGNELLELDDVNVIDILLMISYQLIKDNKELEKLLERDWNV